MLLYTEAHDLVPSLKWENVLPVMELGMKCRPESGKCPLHGSIGITDDGYCVMTKHVSMYARNLAVEALNDLIEAMRKDPSLAENLLAGDSRNFRVEYPFTAVTVHDPMHI